MRWWHWVRRELLNHWTFSLFFALNLALGLTGMAALDLVQQAVQGALKDNERAVLGADIGISVRRLFTESEQQAAQSALQLRLNVKDLDRQESRVLEFLTMIRTADEQVRLVQLKAIDQNYPFYGRLILKSAGLVQSGVSKSLADHKSVWISQELALQLRLQIGDSLRIGKSAFRIADLVEQDNSQSLALGTMGLRVWIDRQAVVETGLVQPGATLTETLLFQFPGERQPNSPTESLARADLFRVLPDPSIQVLTPKLASQEAGRFLSLVADYLGLVSLVGTALAMIGMGYLLRAYLQARAQDIWIYQVLGMTPGQVRILYLLQILVLAVVAVLASVLVSVLLGPLVLQQVSRFFPMIQKLGVLQSSLSVVFLNQMTVGLFAVFAVSVLVLLPTSSRLQVGMATGLVLLGFLGLSAWRSHSWKVGSWFSLGLFATALLMVAMARVSLYLVQFRLTNSARSWRARQALLQILRRRQNSIPLIAVLALTILLVNLVPQIRYNIQQDLQLGSGLPLPDLFLIDIQDEQKESLQTTLEKSGAQDLRISPMIRARLLQINGSAFERAVETGQVTTREEEMEMRFRNRGFNLTSRASLSSSEVLTAGLPFTTQPSTEAQLSVEQGFAQRLHLALGDHLVFDVQGIEVRGQVRNFRKVIWNSFQPNFFIVFQPGFLEDAPKTWVASVGGLQPDTLHLIQSQLLEKFINVSMIDVRQTLKVIQDLIDQIAWSLAIMAALSVLVGGLVIFSILYHQLLERRSDLNLLQILGGTSADLRRILSEEFVWIGSLAITIGLLLCVALSAAVSSFVFETFTTWDWSAMLMSICGFVLGVTLLIAWGLQSMKRWQPSELLQEGGGE